MYKHRLHPFQEFLISITTNCHSHTCMGHLTRFFFLLKEKNVHTPVLVGSPAWFEGTFPRPLHQRAEWRCGGSGGKQAAGREGRGGRRAPGHPRQGQSRPAPSDPHPAPQPAVQAGRGPVARTVCAFGSRRPFGTFSSLPRQLKPCWVTEQEELRFFRTTWPAKKGVLAMTFRAN